MSSAASARNAPQIPQTTGDTVHNVKDAALRGASSAFSKPPVTPKPLANTYTGSGNGALLAATKVGTGGTRNASTSGTTSPMRRDWTGGSQSSRLGPSPMQKFTASSGSSTLGVPDDYFSDRTPSPSNIAAKLAAARHSPMKPMPRPATSRVFSERDTTDRDVLPPAGSVSNVLARLDGTAATPHPPRSNASVAARSAASTIRASRDDEKPTDDTSIPPTTSLVKMFEQNRPTTPTKSRTEPLVVSQRAPPPVRSPKPQRAFKLPPEPKDDAPLERVRTKTPPPVKPKPKVARAQSSSLDGANEPLGFIHVRKDSLGTPPLKQKPPQLTIIKTTVQRPKPPPQRGSRQVRPRSEDLTHSFARLSKTLSMESNENASSPISFVSAKEQQEEEDIPKPKPNLPAPRRSAKAAATAHLSETPPKRLPAPPQARAPNKMTSPMQIPQTFAPPPRRPTSAMAMGSSPPSDTIYHSNYQRQSVKKLAQHMTGESLSNAIVGAALASSRTASPATSAPQLPARKQHHHHSPLHHNRSPSPPKPTAKPTGKLRTTMRKEPDPSDSEDESERYKRKGTRIMGMRRKHPNKHHEGTRKRWRDLVTERERKRYEGVWAANKGLFIPSPSPSPNRNPVYDDPSLEVLNLVVKDIWMRSRLPEHELEEVWALVDSRGVGRLKREEFVVGLWLIDQRLKGRKIPVRVTDSVWGSVRGAGVKIRVDKHGHGKLRAPGH